MTQIIRDRIELLASEVPAFLGQARVICATGASPNAVLEELDCTVLPADLQFRSAGQHLTLRASGRRLVQVIEASANLPFPQEQVGMPLSHNDREMRAHIAETLASFTKAKRALQVVVGPLIDQSALTTSSQSLSVVALKEDLDRLDETASVDLPFLDKIGLQAQEITTAQIWLDGNQVIKTTGDVAAIGEIKAVLTDQLSKWRKVQDQLGHNKDSARLSVFAEVLGSGRCMAMVSQAAQTRLFVLPSTSIPNLCSMFQSKQAE